MKTGKIMNCKICKKEVYRSPAKLNNSKSKNYFCSKSCQTVWRNKFYAGDKHKLWINGAGAYREIMMRNNDPNECKLCGEDNTKLLAVHHIDKNRKNNNIDNLAWLCHNCHHLVHHYKDVEKRFMEVLV